MGRCGKFYGIVLESKNKVKTVTLTTEELSVFAENM